MTQKPEHAARVLGLIGDLSLDAVKRARRDKALQYHPDRCADTARATRHMARVNAAADTLIAYLKDKPQPPRAPAHNAEVKPKDASAKRPVSHPEAASAGATTPKRARPQAAMALQTRTASDAARRAWMAERALAKRATASYQTALGRIGKPKAQRSVDMQILRFEAAGA